MKFTRIRFSGLFVTAAYFTASMAVHAENLVSNPSFEFTTPAIATDGLCTTIVSSPYAYCIADSWAGNYQIGNGPGNGNGSFNIPTEPDGTNALILQNDASAFTTVNAPVDGTYSLTFYAANRAAYNLQMVGIYLDQNVSPVGGTYNNLPTDWTLQTLYLSMTAGPHVLNFISYGTPDASAFIDNITLESTGGPLAPFGLTATPKVLGRAALTWTAASGAESYNVYMGSASGQENPTPVKSNVTSTSTKVKKLTSGQSYCFYVTAVNSNGESAPSNEACMTE